MSLTDLLLKLISATRYIPFVAAIFCVLTCIIHPIGLLMNVTAFIINVNPLFIYTLYILSYLLKFCWKHRLAIHFLSTYWLISFIDSLWQLPITDIQYTLLIVLIASLFLIYYFIRDNYVYIIDYLFKDKIQWMQSLRM